MASIMAATVADIGTTMGALATGSIEVGYFAKGFQLEGNMEAAYLAKFAVSAVLVGIYALTARKDNDWAWGYDKVMKVLSVAMWVWPAINTINIVGGLK